MRKGTEQAQGENAKGQSWTDRKGASYETGSEVRKRAQRNPAQAGIHFIWKEPSYMQSSNTGGSTFWFEFFQEPFSEGEEKRKDEFLLLFLRNTDILETLLSTFP